MKIFLAAASAALAFAATPATADTTVSVEVPYGDLDLSQPAGQKMLDHRVEIALRDVCRQAGFVGAGGLGAWKNCLAKARTEARDQIAEVTPAEAPALASNL